MNRNNNSPNIKIRRSKERGFEDFDWTDNWMTFSFSNYYDPDWIHFGPLRAMIENTIQPHSGFQAHPHRDVEIVTYVISGTLTHKDNFGHSSDITRGEMQHISTGSKGMVHSEENLHSEPVHLYQIWLIPEKTGTRFAYHQLKFTPEELQGNFRLYVSPDGRDGSMPINTDASIYAGLFTKKDNIRHKVEKGRGVWLQMVNGKLRVADVLLTQGDGIGITNIDSIALRFEADSEVLLFDMRMDIPLIWF